jgi:hypothetical protein
MEVSLRGLGDVACTMDAKLCPDGSTVGRVGPDCHFAPCPGAGTVPVFDLRPIEPPFGWSTKIGPVPLWAWIGGAVMVGLSLMRGK